MPLFKLKPTPETDHHALSQFWFGRAYMQGLGGRDNQNQFCGIKGGTFGPAFLCAFGERV
jgi:hypothetical protein